MGQFTQNGVTYEELPNGKVRVVGYAPMITSPTADLARPKAQAELTGTNIGNQKTAFELEQARATAQANRVKAENEAAKSGLDVKTAQVDLNAKAGTPPGDLSKTGAAYIASLPPGVGDLTKEMLSGNYKGSITTSRNPVVMQAALAAAHATNGNFDAGRYDERVALMKGITNPNSQLGALNTAIAHAGMLYDQAPKVAGSSIFGDTVASKAVNALENWWHGGSPEVTKYQSILQKYGPESARAYGVNTGGEREQAQAPLSMNLPLDAKEASLKTDMDLFAGKIASLAHANDILGGNHPIDYLSPEAKAVLMKIDPEGYQKFVQAASGQDNAAASLAGIASTDTGPKPPSPEQQAQFFNILQKQGPDAADAYLRQFGLAMKDKTAANRPYTKALSLPADDKTYANSYLGQGLSGANEGLASVLGAPADLATAAINLIPKGINAVANSHIPEITNPLLGSGQWKQILSGVGSIAPPSDDPSKQFVRRVGESVGSAAVPGMFGGSLPKMGAALLSGLGGGIGGATAQQVAPGNPLAEMGGELVGGGLTGLGLMKAGQRAAQRGIEAAVPTVEDLKAQAGNLYRKAETNGVVASPEQTQQLAAGIHGILRDEGQIGPSGTITNADTNTSKAFNLIQQYAGKEMTPKEMNTVRTVLSDSRQSADPADRRLGSILLDHFDEWASPLAPEFDQARSVASRYLQAQDLERARELAGARASQFTGSGFENALRTEYRGLDRANIKGQNYFSPDVTDAIQTVARGTPVSNTLRGLGRLAPTGPVSGMGSVVPALSIGAMTSPATGGMFGGGLAGLGILGRVGATRMGIRAADNAELIARNGGALDQAPLMPSPLGNYAAWLAAAQQAKYLNGN